MSTRLNKWFYNFLLVISIMAFAIPTLAKTRYLVQGTSDIGGTYYVFGGGVASVINKYVKGVNLTPIPTSGTFECVELLRKEKIDFGQFLPYSLVHAFNATGRYKGKEPYKRIRIITSFYGGAYHYMVREESQIFSFRDLKGKRIGGGIPGQMDYEGTEIMLKAHGLDPKKDVKLMPMGKNDRCDALGDGRLDAAFVSVGLGSGFITELLTMHKIRLLPVEDEILKKINEEHPYYVRGVIPAGSYRGQDKDVVTLWQNSALACNDTLEEELVYQYTKAYWEHFDEIIKVYAPAKQVPTPAKAMEIGTFGLPLHPGAERYYKEIGVSK